jgi:hypothetical protein
VDATVESLGILAGARLTFQPDVSCHLRSTGNVVVQGSLVMRPSRPSILHRIAFVGVDERAFGGGGMSVLDTDVGLWVMDAGTLDLAGSRRLAWARATGALGAGQRSITLDADPVGWQVGDEIVVTPTAKPSSEEDDLQHPSHRADIVSVSNVSGRTVALSQPLAVDHPEVDVGRGQRFSAEVLNLTRNVAIEGTPAGRSHVFIHSSAPQQVRYVGLRNLGPRQRDPQGDRPDQLSDVLGRYGLHFHHCLDGSRGSQIEGVVGRDLGAHAFVPHMSNGTTWRDCIAHDTRDHAYWWDAGENSADTVFDRCVASNMKSNYALRYHNGGFLLGRGPNGSNTVRNCVATNVEGAGFLWYDGGEAVWVAEDSVAHNTFGSGIRVWQNNSLAHTISRFVCYHNDEWGIDHGAYGNSYHYEGGNFVGNRSGAIALRAVSSQDDNGRPLSFSDLYLDAAGTTYAMTLPDGTAVRAARPTLVQRCEFRNAERAALYWYGEGNNAIGRVADCTFDGNEIWLDSKVGRSTRIELVDAHRGRVAIVRRDQRGTSVPEWNAAVQPL